LPVEPDCQLASNHNTAKLIGPGKIDSATIVIVVQNQCPHRLLHMPLAPEIPNLSPPHQRFVAGRSMRDVEPSVPVQPRDPRGQAIANADDLA
jgi:hypothetical protein